MITFAGVDLTPPTDADDPVFYYWHRHCIEEFEFQGYLVQQIQHLPTPFFPRRETPRPGVLTWPTGADTFARCHLICTGDQAVAIRAAVGAAPAPKTLRFDDGAGGVVAPQMYFLALRPISQRGDGAELYLLTLVDERWFWWQSGGNGTPASASSWTSLFDQLYGAVGVTPAIDTISSAYLTPNQPRWALGVQPIPPVAEAAAQTVGLRTVRACDGTVTLQSYASALGADAARWALLETEALTGGRVSGADIARAMPEQCDVCFFDGTATSITLSSLALSEAGGVAGVPTRAARVTADALAPTTAQKIAYATQAALDYYSWGLARTDATFRGFVAVDGPCGLDECVEWVHTPETMVTRVLRPVWSDRNIYGDADPSPSAPVPTPYPTSGSAGPPAACVPDDQGYPPGCAPGDGLDPVGVYALQCILGVLFETTGRKQIVYDGQRLRESWYDLSTSIIGCCGCDTPGGSAANDTCCPASQLSSLNIALLGPFGVDCADTTLLGTLTYQQGAWQGTLTDGTVTAVAKLYCTGKVWQFAAVVTLDGGVLRFVGSPVVEADGTLGAILSQNGATDCDPAEAEVTITHPCPTGSGSPSNPLPGPTICDCFVCPDGAPYQFSFKFSGDNDFAAAPPGFVLTGGGNSCVWQQIINDRPGFAARWIATINLVGVPPQLIITHVDDLGEATAVVVYFYDSCCGGVARSPVILTGTGPVPKQIVVGPIGPCGPCEAVVVACAPAPVPAVLYATFTGVLSALGGTGKVALFYDAVSGTWRSSELPYAPCLQSGTRVIFQCLGGNWQLTYGTLWTPASALGPVDPVGLVFTDTMHSVNCPGSSDGTISSS